MFYDGSPIMRISGERTWRRACMFRSAAQAAIFYTGRVTDDGILLKVEKHKSRTNLASGSRSERELTNENLPKHQRQES